MIRTRSGTVRRWLTAGEKLSLRIERELGIAVATNPEKIRPLGRMQKGHGVISWIARADNGDELTGDQTIGECLAAARLVALKPQNYSWNRQIDIIGDAK